MNVEPRTAPHEIKGLQHALDTACALVAHAHDLTPANTIDGKVRRIRLREIEDALADLAVGVAHGH